ncbi:MAG: MarR family transcriptional regulator [Desulfobacteraceae bacterium]|jgi:DNA-binding MarR family transcriptional regulator
MDAENTEISLIQDNMENIFLALRAATHISTMYSKNLEKEFGVTLGQLLCLRTLLKKNSLSINDISKHVLVSPSTVTGIVDRLQEKGLVKRMRFSEDRRIVHVVISDMGRQVVHSARGPIQRLLANHFKKLALEELQVISEGLVILLEFIKTVEVSSIDL